ncbi:hypothetical protein EJ02DRAFT_427624 [Clathrospora elynae]|uniref:Uncharacterized protein n=1 Tax=Clathrospora elynae TaxID=706981 RepID=A0A6A5S8E2_9PLEO|nr:hypothetical protein EJ02DRAFT_427624 [Clathrospora elynae]
MDVDDKPDAKVVLLPFGQLKNLSITGRAASSIPILPWLETLQIQYPSWFELAVAEAAAVKPFGSSKGLVKLQKMKFDAVLLEPAIDQSFFDLMNPFTFLPGGFTSIVLTNIHYRALDDLCNRVTEVTRKDPQLFVNPLKKVALFVQLKDHCWHTRPDKAHIKEAADFIDAKGIPYFYTNLFEYYNISKEAG